MRIVLLFLSLAISGFSFGQKNRLALTQTLAFEGSYVPLGWVQLNEKLTNTLDSLEISKVVTTSRSAGSETSEGNTDTFYVHNGCVTKLVAYYGTTYEYVYNKNRQLVEKRTLFGGGRIEEIERFMYDSVGLLTYYCKSDFPRLQNDRPVPDISHTIERFEQYNNEDGTPDSVIIRSSYNGTSYYGYNLYDYKHSGDSLVVTERVHSGYSNCDTNYIILRTSGDSTYVESFRNGLATHNDTHVYLNGLPVDDWLSHKGVYQYSSTYGKLGLPAQTYGNEISAEGDFILTYEYYRKKKRLKN